MKILTLNKISKKGLALFGDSYEVANDTQNPDGILVRSAQVDTDSYNGVLAVARAGAGVNNITIDKASEKGVCVFNTPGANANAVAELVFTSLGCALRSVHKATAWMETLKGQSDKEISEAVEKNKSKFVGTELAGNTIGVVGLGKIGVLVANGAIGRGMTVVAYEPYPSVANMVQLSNRVKVVSTLEELIAASEIITVHVPFLPATKNLLNSQNLSAFKGSYLLNLARNGIIEEAAIDTLTASEDFKCYITDFASAKDLENPKVLCMPHLGASTEEAEDNCATMAVLQLKEYLEIGVVRNSVNFPTVKGKPGEKIKTRIVVINHDVPNLIAAISQVFGKAGLNIASFKNESNGKIGYNLIDLDVEVPDCVLQDLAGLDQVVRVRKILF
jgi:D-3-phosphoglycerate dehydrogenase